LKPRLTATAAPPGRVSARKDNREKDGIREGSTNAQYNSRDPRPEPPFAESDADECELQAFVTDPSLPCFRLHGCSGISCWFRPANDALKLIQKRIRDVYFQNIYLI